MHFRILKMIATSGFLTALGCTKFDFGRGSSPDPAGGAYSAPPDLLVRLRGLLLRGGREREGKKGRGGRGRGVSSPSGVRGRAPAEIEFGAL